MAKRVKEMPKEGKHLCLATGKLWTMREVPETNALRAEAVPEAKETGLGAKRIFSEPVPFPAARAGGRSETTMPTPVREPLWYRHWGLNE
jgi:hypothetical protein